MCERWGGAGRVKLRGREVGGARGHNDVKCLENQFSPSYHDEAMMHDLVHTSRVETSSPRGGDGRLLRHRDTRFPCSF